MFYVIADGQQKTAKSVEAQLLNSAPEYMKKGRTFYTWESVGGISEAENFRKATDEIRNQYYVLAHSDDPFYKEVEIELLDVNDAKASTPVSSFKESDMDTKIVHYKSSKEEYFWKVVKAKDKWDAEDSLTEFEEENMLRFSCE